MRIPLEIWAQVIEYVDIDPDGILEDTLVLRLVSRKTCSLV